MSSLQAFESFIGHYICFALDLHGQLYGSDVLLLLLLLLPGSPLLNSAGKVGWRRQIAFRVTLTMGI